MFGIFKRCRDCYPEFIDRPYRDDLTYYWSEKNMFEILLKGISESEHIQSVSHLLYKLKDISLALESDYFKDGNIKDAAIDTICQILQQHKTKKES